MASGSGERGVGMRGVQDKISTLIFAFVGPRTDNAKQDLLNMPFVRGALEWTRDVMLWS